MIEEHHAYRNKDKVINELLGRIALLERAIEEKEKVIEEVRENINKKLNVNSDYVDYDFGTELLRQELLEILEGE